MPKSWLISSCNAAACPPQQKKNKGQNESLHEELAFFFCLFVCFFNNSYSGHCLPWGIALKKKVNDHRDNIQPATIWLDPMYCRPEKKKSIKNRQQLSDLRYLTCCVIWMTLHRIIQQLAGCLDHTDYVAFLTLNDGDNSGNLNLPEATEAPEHYLTRTTL